MKVELFADGERAKFVWWDMADPEMRRMMALMGKMGWENVRLEYWPEHEDGPSRLIVVEKATGEPCGSFNVSTLCPPHCP